MRVEVGDTGYVLVYWRTRTGHREVEVLYGGERKRETGCGFWRWGMRRVPEGQAVAEYREKRFFGVRCGVCWPTAALQARLDAMREEARSE